MKDVVGLCSGSSDGLVKPLYLLAQIVDLTVFKVEESALCEKENAIQEILDFDQHDILFDVPCGGEFVGNSIPFRHTAHDLSAELSVLLRICL